MLKKKLKSFQYQTWKYAENTGHHILNVYRLNLMKTLKENGM